jgi:tetratricopeptide (TPR) repeat protein
MNGIEATIETRPLRLPDRLTMCIAGGFLALGTVLAVPALADIDSARPGIAEEQTQAAASVAAESPELVPATTLTDELLDPLDGVERQLEAEEFDEAASWLTRRLEEIEATSHRFNPDLVRPLTLLGDAEAGIGNYDQALEHYQRALHLSRINGGLNTPDQVEIVYREANAMKALGAFQEANDREEYAYHILSRAHDPTDEALLPGIYHLARWYERTSNVFAARALYEQAAQIIEANEKLDTAAAIPALHGIAKTYRMERFPPLYASQNDPHENSVVVSRTQRQSVSVNSFSTGESALQRIVRIRQAQQPVNRIALASSVLDLADWYTLFDKTDRASALYGHAWELMSEVEDFDVASYFAEPELLYFPAPDNPSPPPPEKRGERSTGYVEVAFNVTDDGYVRNLDTVASQPEGLMDFRVRKSLRIARYRPMLVDGIPVRKDGFTYRHEFPFFPERDSEENAIQVTATATGSD